MTEIKLIECPRDAWQGLKEQIPSYIKIDYLKALISTGFKHIDAVSFVSPNAMPQMADSQELLTELHHTYGVQLIGFVMQKISATRQINATAKPMQEFNY